MRTRLIVGLLIVALAVVASVMINAAPRGRGAPAAPPPGVNMPGPGGPGCPLGMPMLGRLAKELKLTDAQIAELKRHHQEFMTATEATRDQLKAKFKEMVDLWMVDEPNAADIKAKADEIDALKVEIRNAGIDHMIGALTVLTPAQREKLRTIIKEHAGKFGMGCGMCGGPGGGMGMGPGGAGGPGCCPKGMGGGMGMGPRAGTGSCPLTK